MPRSDQSDCNQHARIESLAFIHHLVSDISATLRSDRTMVDLVKAIFPCGSVTGAPKITAMQTISKLENTTRGIFTGALGTIASRRTASFNVAIRSALNQKSAVNCPSWRRRCN